MRQLVVYHSVLSTHKFVTTGKPKYLHQAMSTSHPLNTRQAAGGQIHVGSFDSKQGLLHDGFKYRAAKEYNLIPAHIRSVRSLTTFKKKLKQWVLEHISVG